MEQTAADPFDRQTLDREQRSGKQPEQFGAPENGGAVVDDIIADAIDVAVSVVVSIFD